MKPMIIREVEGGKRIAFVSRQAFIDLVISALEVYKKEAFGLLIGRTEGSQYFISDIIPYQSAQRSYEWVNMSSQRINRINFALGHLTNHEVIGDYHSHPQGPDKLSATDVSDLFKGARRLTCLLSVYKKKSCEPWRHEDYSIMGSIGGRYFVRLMAYEVDRKRGIIHRINVVCPYMKRVNKAKLFKTRVKK
ncbi:MAG TPA: Mov34/MPN/PAD-1 family protein [Candidatus Nanoarchaeia archaeon]|nr:Mov34/MPN/PAD-1 family protein [Candidatus Nanoarchaeia archaeon]